MRCVHGWRFAALRKRGTPLALRVCSTYSIKSLVCLLRLGPPAHYKGNTNVGTSLEAKLFIPTLVIGTLFLNDNPILASTRVERSDRASTL